MIRHRSDSAGALVALVLILAIACVAAWTWAITGYLKSKRSDLAPQYHAVQVWGV
jgi:hypothetical protein